MADVSFSVSDADRALIKKIAEKARQRGLLVGYSRLDFEMDLTATHANGCPLDLQKLLDAPQFDFVHDMVGIQGHLNRQTGKLESFFRPRCVKPAQEVANG